MRNSLKIAAKSHDKTNEITLLHNDLGFITIRPGITTKQINELLQVSKIDKTVNQYTLDSKRFKNRETYNKWLQKGRLPYTLSNKSGNLLGLIWFRRAEFPKVILHPSHKKLDTKKYTITFAVRTYAEARGRGLARKFIINSMRLYQQSPEYASNDGKGIWLTTSLHNLAAVNTYKTLFTQVTKPTKQGKIVMVLDPQNIY
ncbi:MAG: hypothetical protein ABII80_01860 [bacterium]